MIKGLPFLIPFVVFAVVILVALGILIHIPDYIASFLQRTWRIDPTAAALLGILGWVAVGFVLVYLGIRISN
ncbi:MAG: hypothetical protein ACE5JU_17190 [Candidatus Binatia bacterium]